MKTVFPGKYASALVVIVALWVAGLILRQAAAAVQSIDQSPAWLPPALDALAGVAGALLLLPVLYLLWIGARWLYQKLMKLDLGLGAANNGAEKEPGKKITRDLYQAVNRLDRHGVQSRELVDSAVSQTLALVEICKNLQRRASEQNDIAMSLQEALKAITLGDPLKIKEAAGGVRDRHIASLMLLSTKETDPDYWESVAGLVAAQLGVANRWQAEYRKLTASMIGEVSAIKAQLVAATAHIEAAEAARPLLEARVNLENAGRLLSAPVSDVASPARLFAPQNEYVLMSGSES